MSILELGTVAGGQRPLIVLTSNATRELSEALRRRCLYIDYPDVERERQIVRARVPEVGEQLAGQIAPDGADHPPAGAEEGAVHLGGDRLARTLLQLERTTLDPATVDDTLHLLQKHERDIQRARAELGRGPR